MVGRLAPTRSAAIAADDLNLREQLARAQAAAITERTAADAMRIELAGLNEGASHQRALLGEVMHGLLSRSDLSAPMEAGRAMAEFDMMRHGNDQAAMRTALMRVVVAMLAWVEAIDRRSGRAT